jgi:hypothetical protein
MLDRLIPAPLALHEAEARPLRRDAVLDAVGAGLVAVLLAAVLWRALKETGGTNSYALLADAWLHGRLAVEGCFDIDCVRRGSDTHVIFPPFPGLVAAPLVALSGASFAGFVGLSLALAGLSAACWWSIAGRAGLDRRTRAWFVAAVVLASPAFYVTIRGDGIWFFAQSVAFALFSGMMWACVVRRSALLAGACLGALFLSRQMTILAAPAAFVLLMRPEERLLALDAARIKRALVFAAPIVAAIALYLVYNAARFGHPLDTGYGLLTLRNSGSLLDERLVQHGTFSSAYFVQNLFYLTVQGFHAEFTGAKSLTLTGLDHFGTALLAGSPWLFAALLARPDRRLAVCGATALGIAGITLFYHSNGFSQYNAQRYALDWLPLLLVFIPTCFARLNPTVMRGLVIYGLGLNVVMLAVLQVTKG